MVPNVGGLGGVLNSLDFPWNQLSVSVCHATSVSSFTSYLKTSTSQKPFQQSHCPEECVCVCVCVCVFAFECSRNSPHSVSGHTFSHNKHGADLEKVCQDLQKRGSLCLCCTKSNNTGRSSAQAALHHNKFVQVSSLNDIFVRSEIVTFSF